MTRPSLLVAGMSARAIATSAQRAGYIPLIVDAFGDEDTREVSHCVRTLPRAYQHGFRASTLLPVLDELKAEAPTPPIGIVLGAGFEDRPGLIATLNKRFRILGCQADSVKACKDPVQIDRFLKTHHLPYPLISATHEAEANSTNANHNWISKRVGGTGGSHIQVAERSLKPQTNHYFQRVIDGPSHAFVFVASPAHNHIRKIGFTQQWCAPTIQEPYRYGGAVGPVELPLNIQEDLCFAAGKLMQTFGLCGLASLDFVIDPDGQPVLVDINPRPGASLDVFDTEETPLIDLHIKAATETQPNQLQSNADASSYRAAAYLYAEQDIERLPSITWPIWTRDRPHPEKRITKGMPITTVVCEHASPDRARTNCRQNLATLSDMLESAH